MLGKFCDQCNMLFAAISISIEVVYISMSIFFPFFKIILTLFLQRLGNLWFLVKLGLERKGREAYNRHEGTEVNAGFPSATLTQNRIFTERDKGQEIYL